MLTRERAIDLFSYNPDVGHLVRRIAVSNQPKGAIAGHIRTTEQGYRCRYVKIDRIAYVASRVIWLMQTNIWPNCIDHINGNALDNRWSNLRSVTNQQNRKNLPLYANNTVGLVGVYWQKSRSRWNVSIQSEDRKINLYAGRDFFEACCRRKAAELRYGFHINHGQRLQNQAVENEQV